MKLCRYGKPGFEKPGIIDSEGKLRDLSKVIENIGPNELSPRGPKMLAKVKPETLPVVANSPRMGVPYVGIGKFVAIGLNYSDHAKEAGMAIPPEPIVFMKATSCIQGPDDDVMLPKGSKKSDWEVELAIVIGKTALYIEEKNALDYVAGFCVCNDISERAFQTERGGQWMKGKGSPTFGPLGPWLVTKDEIKDVQNLDMFLDLNGKRVQNGSTKTMVFGVAHLVAYISQFMQLDPGDVITTGTPPGVGMGMKPPVYLKAGDTMKVGIAGLGEQHQKVEAYKG